MWHSFVQQTFHSSNKSATSTCQTLLGPEVTLMTKTGTVFPITIFGSQERKGIELITEVRLRVSDWSQDWEDRHWNQPKRR